MIRAFIFDLDGTLANTEPLHFRAWRQTLLNNGIPEFTFDTFLSFVGTNNEKVAGDYIKSHNLTKTVKEIVFEKQDIYMQLIPEIELCSGVRDILSAYHGRMKMAVASSSHKKEVLAILDANGLTRYFSHVVSGDMVEKMKPDPEIYLNTQKKLGVPVENCIAFEDSSHGLNAAKNACMYGIAIPNEFTSNHDFSRANLIISSLSEVDDTLLEKIVLDSSY